MAKDKLNAGLKRRFQLYKTQKVDYSLTLFQLYIEYKGICQNCKCKTIYGQHPTVDSSATIEHIIPIASGGNHIKSNVTLLCQSCNYSKNKTAQIKMQLTQNNVYMKIFNLFGYTFYYKKNNND